MLRRAAIIVPALVALAALGAGLLRSSDKAQVGRPAPSFSLPDVREPSSRLGLPSGRPVVLNFWASWCVPCREEAEELARTHRDRGGAVAFLGVDMLDGRSDAVAFLDRYGIGYPSVHDASGSVARRYAVAGVPETVFIAADGTVAGRYIGALGGQLGTFVDRLVAGRPLDITGRGASQPVP